MSKDKLTSAKMKACTGYSSSLSNAIAKVLTMNCGVLCCGVCSA